MKTQSSRPKIAVIGAGWAGLSAAVRLAPRSDLTLFEAGRSAGGRARTIKSGGGFSFTDNGQHILLGAYHGVLALMRQIGVSEQQAFLRMPLQWHISDGLQFQAASLPAPLHIIAGLLKAKNFSFGEKVKLLNDMHALQQRQRSPLPQPAATIAQWLHRRNTHRKALMQFWQPLVLGALNTPPESACLDTLCHVLQDGVWAEKSAGDYLLPKQDLGSIIAEPSLKFLAAYQAHIRMETRVTQLAKLPSGRVCVNGEAFDAAVLAVAPYHAAALLPPDTPDSVQAAFTNMTYHAITTVYLRYAETVHLPAQLTGLAEGTAQWFVHRAALGLPDNETAAVISVSDHIGRLKNEEWIARVHADLKTLCPYLGEPLATQVITEQRATTAATPQRPRPDTAWLHQCRIYPAGDYLHPRYPATLEAAVQSGATAAELCLAEYRPHATGL